MEAVCSHSHVFCGLITTVCILLVHVRVKVRNVVADHVDPVTEMVFADGCGLFQPSNVKMDSNQHMWDVLDKQV